jgi:molecular chaperone Hsp33
MPRREVRVSDKLELTLADGGGLRIRAALTSVAAREAIARHKMSATAGRVLADALTAVALLPIEHNKHDRVSIQWVGRGLLISAFAELRVVDDEAHLRGYVGAPQAEIPAGTSGIFPPGRVVVMRQRPDGNHDLGQAELHDPQLDRSLESFMRTSDQVATSLFCGSHHEGDALISGGVLVQRMPDGPELPSLDRPALRDALKANDLDALLDAALPDAERQHLGSLPLRFACPCSLERVKRGVLMLEPEEIAEHAADGSIGLDCQFCGQTWTLNRIELEALLIEKRSQA